MNDGNIKNIVILGGGFGGVACALQMQKLIDKSKLLREQCQIILIDKNNAQTYIPALYEIASTVRDQASAYELKCCVGTPYEQICQNKAIKFIQAKINKIDASKKQIFFEGKEPLQNFDYMVIALGSVSNYFNIPGLEEFSHPLKTYEDALHLRNELENIFAGEIPNLKIAIGGAGLTGIELGGEMGSLLKQLEKKYNISSKNVEVYLIEGAPQILPGMNQKSVLVAQKRLLKLGVQIKTGKKIIKVEENKVYLDDGSILDNAFIIWTGGVKPSPILSSANLPLSSKGSIIVNEFLQSQNPKIYAVGDGAYFVNKKTGQSLVWTAPTAIAQGKCAAENIFYQLTNKPLKPFQPKDYPVVIPIGQKFAITSWHNLVVSGFSSWIFKHLIMLNHLFSILPFFPALKTWLRQMKVYIKND